MVLGEEFLQWLSVAGPTVYVVDQDDQRSLALGSHGSQVGSRDDLVKRAPVDGRPAAAITAALALGRLPLQAPRR